MPLEPGTGSAKLGTAKRAESGARFIVVEGPIGVGKTTLVRRLAEQLGGTPLLEEPAENPFLPGFYENARQAALPTQLFFLLQRVRQMATLLQGDLFRPLWVADFMLEKDRIFAELTLDGDEYRLYDQLYAQLDPMSPRPDLTIYLQAPVTVLQERIARRGIAYEQGVEGAFLQRLADAYTRFFHDYHASPLLIVNAAAFDPAGRSDHLALLLDAIAGAQAGRHYFNPQPSIL